MASMCIISVLTLPFLTAGRNRIIAEIQMKHNFCQIDIYLHHSDYFKAFPCCDFYNISSVLNENEKYTHHLARYLFHRPKFETTLSQAAAMLEGFC